jgi:hypothetical protein
MKKALKVVIALVVAVGILAGCSYGGVGTVGDKVIITRNDMLLWGALRKVYVCKVADSGVTGCVDSAEAP